MNEKMILHKYDVNFLPISETDRKQMCNGSALDNRTKVVVKDREGHVGYMYVANDEIEMFGQPYIESHVSLQYSKPLDDWFVLFDRNEYFNDLNRNPLRTIKVEFVEIERGTGREVYRGVINKRYYLRENHTDEGMAIWSVCGKIRKIDDGDMPRANLLFQHGNQLEQVTYHDCRVAAWQNTYNKDFAKGVLCD